MKNILDSCLSGHLQTSHTDIRGKGYFQATDVQFVGLTCSMDQEPMTISHRQRCNDILRDCTKGRVPLSEHWALFVTRINPTQLSILFLWAAAMGTGLSQTAGSHDKAANGLCHTSHNSELSSAEIAIPRSCTIQHRCCLSLIWYLFLVKCH